MSTIIKMMSRQNLADNANSKDYSVITIPPLVQFEFSRDHESKPWLNVYLDDEDKTIKSLPIHGNVYITYPNGDKDTYSASMCYPKSAIIKAYERFYNESYQEAKERFEGNGKNKNKDDFLIGCIIADLNINEYKFNLEENPVDVIFGHASTHLLRKLDLNAFNKRLNELGYVLELIDNLCDLEDEEDCRYLIGTWKEEEDSSLFNDMETRRYQDIIRGWYNSNLDQKEIYDHLNGIYSDKAKYGEHYTLRLKIIRSLFNLMLNHLNNFKVPLPFGYGVPITIELLQEDVPTNEYVIEDLNNLLSINGLRVTEVGGNGYCLKVYAL